MTKWASRTRAKKRSSSEHGIYLGRPEAVPSRWLGWCKKPLRKMVPDCGLKTEDADSLANTPRGSMVIELFYFAGEDPLNADVSCDGCIFSRIIFFYVLRKYTILEFFFIY